MVSFAGDNGNQFKVGISKSVTNVASMVKDSGVLKKIVADSSDDMSNDMIADAIAESFITTVFEGVDMKEELGIGSNEEIDEFFEFAVEMFKVSIFTIVEDMRS